MQGAGKDSFFDWFGNEMIGSKYYLNIQGLSQLENFNALLSCKLMVVLNEFEIRESITNKEKFKALITNVVNIINEKNEKMRKEKDFINYYLLTNYLISFIIENGDRRLAATEANNLICNVKEYFDKLYQRIYGKDKNGEYVGKSYIAPFFHYLLQRDVANKDWINTRVKTEYYLTSQEHSISPLVKFFEYMNTKYVFQGERYDGRACEVIKNKSIFTATDLYTFFKDFRTNWNYKSADWSATLFATHLKTYLYDEEKELLNNDHKFIQKKKSNLTCYVLDNERMTQFLHNQGIINLNGKCLINIHK